MTIYNLDEVIKELILVSHNERLNYALPDDHLLDKYEIEIEIGIKFSEDLRKALKEISNISFGPIEFIAVTQEKNTIPN